MKAQLEPIAATGESSFSSHIVTEPRFNHPLHYHPEIEITYIIRSKGTRLVGDHVGSFDEGDLCLIGENLPHLYNNTTESIEGAAAEVLQFGRGFSAGFIDATPELLAFSKLLDKARLGLHFSGEVAVEAGVLLKRIRQSQGFLRLFTFLELIGCLLSAKEIRTLSTSGYTGISAPQDSERMQVVCQYILDHFAEEIDHRELAALVHLVPSSLSRMFKRATGKTCTAFINEIRLGHACRLLLETNASITEIAFDCGFRNLSNFNRRFRGHYHCCPREYRRLGRIT